MSCNPHSRPPVQLYQEVYSSTESNGALEAIKCRYPQGVDITVESTGFEALVDDGMAACRKQGTFVFLGWYPERVSFHFHTPHQGRLNAVFPAFIGERPIRESVIRWIDEGRLDMKSLISHEINWREAEALYNELFTNRRNSYNGITIQWDKS